MPLRLVVDTLKSGSKVNIFYNNFHSNGNYLFYNFIEGNTMDRVSFDIMSKGN
jgi:hypothetical protein